MRRILVLASCLCLSLGLAACSWFDFSSEDDTPPPADYSSCPQLSVVRELSIYQNPAQSNEDTLVMNAVMGKPRSTCGGTSDGLQVNGSIDVLATKGPNAKNTIDNLPFFVSVVDASNRVLRKDLYEIPVDFENGRQQLRTSVPFSIAVPLKQGESGTAYRVLAGFNLEAEQVNANMAYFGTGAPEAASAPAPTSANSAP